ncbi:MAG: TIGR03663 family protein [Verrucomicrobiae bacterium]|nr:TIGR03663 family protein [Verrucomicrobiae bacterium]NNJ42619.1 TIGR03663 family protein [Akkermansiaceae bacterium]
MITLAAFLRFDELSDRPFHFDEATGARITSQRINPAADYQFNPVHNHGPLLSAAAAPICQLNGETSWRSMSKLSLRIATATAGTLLVMIPLCWRRRFGDIPMLAASALLATSPLLVYFSRMFIHEMILALCGLAALALVCVRPKYSHTLKFGVVGGLVGLMFATKESFAISIIAWTAAGAIVALSHIRKINQHNTSKNRQRLWREFRMPALSFAAAAGISASWYYTDGFSNLMGAWDAVRTFFVYQTGAGHDKPFSYYFEMLAVPSKGGVWWFETPILVLATIALIRSYLPSGKRRHQEDITRFLAFSAIFHILIYSTISYKTPWLMCLPWAHVCLLAGLSFRGFSQWKTPIQAVATLVLIGVIFQQNRLTRYATGRFANDARNPYAYAPTSRDVESIRTWMRDLTQHLPPAALEPVAVVGTEYWPLPWYLRDFDAIGYWPEPTPAVSQCPLVFAMPEMADDLQIQLEKSHVALPRTLRSHVPVILFLRNDHWQQWNAPESP